MKSNQTRRKKNSITREWIIRLSIPIVVGFILLTSFKSYSQNNVIDSTTYEYAIAHYQLLGLHESAIFIHYENDPDVENFGTKFNLKLFGNSMKNVKVIFRLLHYMNQKGFTLASSEYVGKYPSDVTEYIFVRRKK